MMQAVHKTSAEMPNNVFNMSMYPGLGIVCSLIVKSLDAASMPFGRYVT